MKNKWTYKDIIDLEYLFLRDSIKNNLPSDAISKRDRDLYLGLMKKGILDESSMDKDLILSWTREMLGQGHGHLLCQKVMRIWKILICSMVIAGFVTGASAVSAVLHYSGYAPVNVATFLAVTVLTHWFLMLLLLSRAILGIFSRSSKNISYPPLYSFIRKLSVIMVEMSIKAGLSKDGLTPESMSNWLLRMSKLYASAFFWPLFILAQVFGLSVSLASLGVTLVRVAFTDLAFGWQSTIDTAPSKIYSIAAFLSYPWSWFLGEGIGFPDAASVAGSRMVLKEGIVSLSTPDLASWWPFLCLCIIFYALLPRLLFLVYGILIARKCPDNLDFSHAECGHLLLRMRSPLFDTRAEKRDIVEPPETIKEIPTAPPQIYEQTEVDDSTTGTDIVIVSGDFIDLAGENKTKFEVSRLLYRDVSGVITYDPEPFFEKKATEKLDEMIKGLESCSVSLVIEAWQPPILETMDFIGMIRSSCGKNRMINIILSGKPEKDSAFTKPSDTDRSIWSNAVSRLADPYILITEFGK